MKKKKTIGFIIDWTENPYHISLLNGLLDNAENYDVNILIFVAGSYKSIREWEKPRNILYNIINIKNVDGLIISSGSIGDFVTQDDIAKLFLKYKNIPCVSISQKIPKIPSILVDSKPGLEKMISHLIEDHKYKNFAFIKGPEYNQEAIERYEIFKKALKKAGLKVNPKIIFPGNFVVDAGIKTAEKIIKTKEKIDVIVSANDDMAWGVIETFFEKNITVPNKYAVVGFDDQSLSKFISPPLTTVRQPLYNQGKIALEYLLLKLDGIKIPDEIYLPTECIIRESCGCMQNLKINIISTKDNKGVYNSIDELKDELIKNIERSEFSELYNNDNIIIENLIISLLNSIEKNKENIFLENLNLFLNEIKSNEEDENTWQILFNLTRSIILKYYKKRNKISFIEDLIFKAKMIIFKFIHRKHGYFLGVSEHLIREYRDINERLVSIKSTEDLVTLLSEELPHIGLKSCFLSLYNTPNPVNLEESLSNLFFAYSEKELIRLKKDQEIFPTIYLIPQGMIPKNQRYSIIVEPLFFGETQMGLALFEMDKNSGIYSNMLRRMFLNSAFKITMFVLHIQHQAENLETKVEERTKDITAANRLLTKMFIEKNKVEKEIRDLNEELEKRVQLRTEEFKNANKELKKTLKTLKATQDKLVQSEKMAALGELVAGVAHEINTPIGIGVTAVSHLEKKTKELIELYNDEKLTKSDFDKYISVANEASIMVLSNLKRAYDLIRSFKKIAVDQTAEEKRLFNLKDYINETLISLQPKLKKKKHSIILECENDLNLLSYPGAFSQIITNLVTNSAIHAFEEKQQGNILIKIYLKKEDLIFEYSDDGKGIPKSYRKRIFDPFFTTKRGQGGTGLGLHLVFNIVTQRLKGTINCISSEKKGTKFEIKINKKELFI